MGSPILNPKDFKVAIVGGGIGGLTTALCLSYHCPDINITVYEQAPVYKEIGAGIGIGVNAARILHRIRVGDDANAISGDRNGTHRSMRRFDNGEEICQVEAMDEPKETNVRQLAVRIEDGGNEVQVHFQDGTSAKANLVIGADGIHSIIRSQFATDPPCFSGTIAYRGLLPLDAIAQSWPFPSYSVSWLGRGKHFLTFPISKNKILNVVGFVSKPEEELGDLKESWTSTADRGELEAEYEGWDPSLLAVIRNMDQTVGKWRINDRDLLKQWVYLDGKAVLLGDAAHAMLPHQGSGAGYAIEDAYILGLALKDFFAANAAPPLNEPGSSVMVSAPRLGNSFQDRKSLSTWMQVYQLVRLPRAQKSQIASRESGNLRAMQGSDFEGLSYEECLPVVREKLKGRMKSVWGADIGADYEALVKKTGLRG
ncbi:FAD/NAD(P)-binding domain-containing protein [Rhizodiscina lignyota]|uniref:FAD/NAD(P)-binding domain-containing protein n=1 Tax=Rhizodiscina lignyota TaxID=1504668 RepID=A0A9P4IPP1_9PEZI|nr:FAD/NAD(P)-binding domain-containing protein [Rhizodiscina lignyota]